METFEESGIFVNKANVSLQTTGLATQLLKIKNQYESLVKLAETKENANYTVKEEMQAFQDLDLGENTCDINPYLQKKNAKQ